MSRTSDETTVEVSGRWILETEKAVRFRVDKIGDREMMEPAPYWFPLSQVSSLLKQPLEDNYKLDTIRVKEWLVNKNGMYEKLKPVGAVPVKDSNVYGSRVPEAYESEIKPKPGYFDDMEDDIPF